MMKKTKIYLDTSVISHLKQDDVPDKVKDTIEFWNDLKANKYEVYISDITLAELAECKEEKQIILAKYLDELDYVELTRNKEVFLLADEYIKEGILTKKSYDDCLHLAIASIASCNIIVSWNFKHMVRYKTIEGVRRINAYRGYFNFIDIIQPTLLLDRSDLNE